MQVRCHLPDGLTVSEGVHKVEMSPDAGSELKHICCQLRVSQWCGINVGRRCIMHAVMLQPF